MYLSIVVPCYNEEENVELFYETVVDTFKENMDEIEIIFINDGSKDNTLLHLKPICEQSLYHIKVIDFSRNFGKEAALLAGLENAGGEFVSIIDADLQQHPSYIIDMLNILKEKPEYDCVAAYQDVRKEGVVLSWFKRCFYKLINKMTEVDIVQSASDFRVLKRKVVDAIISLPEKCRFSKGIFSWVGFNTYYMPYVVEERVHGTSKWSFWKLFAYAIDGIVAFSTIPLVVASILGMILFVIAVFFILVIIIKTIVWGDPVAGFPTLACLILLTAGIQLLCIGVLGQYLAKNYTESKKRPMYIVKDIWKNKM